MFVRYEEFVLPKPKEDAIVLEGTIIESLPNAMHSEADEMLYVVAGDATLKLAEKEMSITSGWFSIVPRGTPYSISRKGRNPVILLSLVGGPPCAPAASSQR